MAKTRKYRMGWQQAVINILIAAALVGIGLLQRDTPTILLCLVLGAYVIFNGLWHWRHHDRSKETLYEYGLLALAVLLVLGSALTH